MVKNLPGDTRDMQETQETWVQCLGEEDPLEEGVATNSSILAWRIPWTEESGGLQSMYSPWGRMDALSSNPSVTLDSSLFLTSIRQQVLSRLPQRPIFSLSTPLHPSFCHLLF